MTAFIFLVAVVNVMFGYAAAVALVEPPMWAGVIDAWRRRRELKAQAAKIPIVEEPVPIAVPLVAAAVTLADVPAIPSVVHGIEELPADWLSQLAAEGI